MSVRTLALCALLLASCRSTGGGWDRVHPGVWTVECGTAQPLTLSDAAGARPKAEALADLSEADFPFDLERVEMESRGGRTYLRFPLERDEKLFGFGLQFQSLNQRGRILGLHVDHYGKQDSGRTHAPVPFYVSSRGYGVFVDSAEYLTVYAGTGVRRDADDPATVRDRNSDSGWRARPYSDSVEILVPAEGARVVVLAGESPLDVVRRFNLMNGGGVLPPKWGLGFTHRVPRLYSDEDVLQEIREFEEHDFPLDFVGLEPGWQSHAYPCSFDWDPNRFPDPAGFVRQAADRGVGINLWFNPYVAPSSSIYEELLPHTSSHTVWNGIIPDLSLPAAREIVRRHFDEALLDVGVEGFKIDEVDGYDFWLWPDTARFPSGHTAEQMRQTYGLMVQDLLLEAYRDRNLRTYGLVRGTNGASSRLPFAIYNDNYSHQEFITALVNSSFGGILWTPEVRSSSSAEEWLRRMQSVCFSPMAMINAWASGTKPWSFPEVEGAVRDVAKLRMQLLPYLYTTFAQYAFEGTPPVRAMHLAFDPGDGEEDWQRAIRSGVKDQFMLGDSLLVAPAFAGETKRRVVFPRGRWYDFYTGQYVAEAQIVEVEAPLERIPLFVRDGGILPMTTSRRHARVDDAVPLIIRHYGERGGSFDLYDDDGETFDYENGELQWRAIEVTKSGNRWTGKIAPAKVGLPNSYLEPTWRFMTESR